MSQSALDELCARFFGAFSNAAGAAPVHRVYELCLQQAIIVNATAEPPIAYDVRAFVEPREALLANGTLTDFREYELSNETTLRGPIAWRTSRYAKEWIENGLKRQATGTKVFGFVLTTDGWRIASLLWHDDPSAA
ncbi:MAG: DUF4440 domain-containing protein [bacterium]|nr:DUF4440 domain-containing protein [bacterium]